MPKPSTTAYPVYFKQYVDQVPEEDLSAAFSNQWPVINNFLSAITEERSIYAYAAGKWTIKEVLQHIIDTERIFNYRALCFSRKETASLPGFNENDYAANAHANARTWQNLVEEFMAVRQSTEWLFNSFSDDMMTSFGLSNNNPASVQSLGFITIGHFYHHQKVIEDKYLSK